MDHTKLDTAYLKFPCRELSNGGLGFVAALTFLGGTIFCACSYWGSNPAVTLLCKTTQADELANICIYYVCSICVV